MNNEATAELITVNATTETTSEPAIQLTDPNGPPSQQKYMIDLIEYQRGKVQMEYVTKRYDKSEATVKNNVRTYYGGLNDDMRAVKRQLETAKNMMAKAINKPEKADIVCEMAIDELFEAIKTIDGFSTSI